MGPNGTLNPRRLLVCSLWVIGVTALAAGAAAIALNAMLPQWTGFGEEWNFIIIGACLALYGLFVIRIARADPLDESLVRAQDYDLWLRLSRAGRMANLPDVLYRHRLRPGCVGRRRLPGPRACTPPL